jgi:translation initiation factor IF-1
MATTTNIVPIRIDATSTDKSKFRIIDTLLIDTTCLPVSHVPQPKDGTPEFSLPSLIDQNAAYLTESLLTDAEVYGCVRSSGHYLGGRLDLLSDVQLYNTIKEQIGSQLTIAVNVNTRELISRGVNESGVTVRDGSSQAVPETMPSASENNGTVQNEGEGSAHTSNIIRIKIRLRQENIVVVDEFDYDTSLSGLEGSDPFSIANGMVEDFNLPPEFAVSIATSIFEQIYGIDIPESVEGVAPGASRDVPGAYVLNVTQEGTSTAFLQMIMDT